MDSSLKCDAADVISRNTKQRAYVLESVRTLCGHPTSADVYEAVRKKHDKISRATVYRNLDVLVDKGEIARIEVPSGAARYDAGLIPHYHLRCRGCGQILDVEMPYLEDLAQRVNASQGFTIEGHQIMFEGVCASCKER